VNRELKYKEWLQTSVPTAVWSKGVALSRDAVVQLDRMDAKDGETRLKVLVQGRAVAYLVTLFLDDQDGFCSCEEKTDFCSHVVAASIWLSKNGEAVAKQNAKESPDADSSRPLVRLVYIWEKVGDPSNPRLRLARSFEFRDGTRTPLAGSLIGFVGGVRSGRIAKPLPAISPPDYQVDECLEKLRSGETPASQAFSFVHRIFKALEDSGARVELGNDVVRVAAKPVTQMIVIKALKDGAVELSVQSSLAADEEFEPGIVRTGDTLRVLDSVPSVLLGGVRVGRAKQKWELSKFNDYLRSAYPTDKTKYTFMWDGLNEPEVVYPRPRIQIDVQADDSGEKVARTFVARLLYGKPIDLEVFPDGKSIEAPGTGRVVVRDETRERELLMRLKDELNLTLRSPKRFEDREAIAFEQAVEKAFGAVAKSKSKKETLSAGLEFGWNGKEFKFSTAKGAGQVGVASVLEAFQSGQSFVKLEDGGFGELNEEWINAHIHELRALLWRMGSKQPLTKAHKIRFASLSSKTDSKKGVDEVVESLFGREKKPPKPYPLQGIQLRPYQDAGVEWLSSWKARGLGCCLADEMGLGKTIQALAVLDGKSLLVVPKSLIGVWEQAIRLHRTDLAARVWVGSNRAPEVITKVAKNEIIILTYGVLRSDVELLRTIEWNMTIFDEAHVLRNRETLSARAAAELQSKVRIALTGTPIENRVEDWWSLQNLINPGISDTRSDVPEWSKWFVMARKKREVLKDLPEKVEELYPVVLDSKEHDLYRGLFALLSTEVLEQLGAETPVWSSVFEALLRLRQACVDPALLPAGMRSDEFDRMESSRTVALMERLEEVIARGEKALVFSQWTSFLDRLELALDRRNIERLRIDGTTRDRSGVVDKFQTDATPSVLLLSLKAGGVGLTLTKANHVFLMDPWWNPQVESQAMDRAHRIGSMKTVFVTRFVSHGTIEERVVNMQESKRKLLEEALNRDEGQSAKFESGGWSREELMGLFRQ
jgi:superfamily II DNA or RNA helicase